MGRRAGAAMDAVGTVASVPEFIGKANGVEDRLAPAQKHTKHESLGRMPHLCKNWRLHRSLSNL
jgi:hypothetical protein